jgi:hypothetical protein
MPLGNPKMSLHQANPTLMIPDAPVGVSDASNPEPETETEQGSKVYSSDGWGDETAQDEQAFKEAELYQAKQELKQALRSLFETICSGSTLATLMGFAIAVIGFIRLLSFKDIWVNMAIWALGLLVFAIFREE